MGYRANFFWKYSIKNLRPWWGTGLSVWRNFWNERVFISVYIKFLENKRKVNLIWNSTIFKEHGEMCLPTICPEVWIGEKKTASSKDGMHQCLPHFHLSWCKSQSIEFQLIHCNLVQNYKSFTSSSSKPSISISRKTEICLVFIFIKSSHSTVKHCC